MKSNDIKKFLVEYKGGKCEKCGYHKCIQALEFHHRNPEEKKFALSKISPSISLTELAAEVDKCILLCANCHRELHSGYTESPTDRRCVTSNKLTDDDVREIRIMLNEVGITRKYIANKFKISVKAIDDIYSGKTWKFVT